MRWLSIMELCMDDYIEELLTNHEEDFGIYELDDASDMDDAVEI